MKALAIDCAVSKITIAAKNDDHVVTGVYDIGMKQSETLLPAIDYALLKTEINPLDLDYISITTGPGSFTGLRLGISAAKAIEMSASCPLYGINSLDAYAEPEILLSKDYLVISCIDAKKERFYAEIFANSEKTTEAGDYTIPELISLIKKASEKTGIKKYLICGPDSLTLKEMLKDEGFTEEIVALPFRNCTTDSLFILAEKMISEDKAPMNEYDGPVYLRASEAEVKLNS